MRKLLLLSLLVIIGNPAFAYRDELKVYVSELMDEVFAVLHNDKLSIQQKTDKERELLRKNIDTKWMARSSLGRAARTIPKEKIDEFTVVYGEYIINNYADVVKKYKNEKVEVKGVQQVKNLQDFYMVKTVVIKNSDSSVSIDYLVNNVDDKFLVSDIITEGVSLVSSQRAEFSGIISSFGIDELIARIKAKNLRDKTNVPS